MKVVVSGNVWLPIDELTGQQIVNIRNSLTIYPKKTTDIATKADPSPIYMYEERENVLGVPRAWYRKNVSKKHDEDIRVSYGKKISDLTTRYKATGNFLEQEAVIRTFLARMEDKKWDGFLLKAGCAWGKTACSLEFARRIGRKTLIIVHKEFFLKQWKRRIRYFMPDAKVGIIRQNKCEFEDCDFVIAMLQSLVRDKDSNKYPKRIYESEFGIVISDECFVGSTNVIMFNGDNCNICDVKKGDLVLNAIGVGQVEKVVKRIAKIHDLRLVKTDHGNEYICTKDHPWLTPDGWIIAEHLTGRVLLTSDDTIGIMHGHGTQNSKYMSMLWEEGICKGWKEILFLLLCKYSKKKRKTSLRSLQKYREAKQESILFNILSEEVDENEFRRNFYVDFGGGKDVAQGKSFGKKKSFSEDDTEQSNEKHGNKEESFSEVEGDRAQTKVNWWKWSGNVSSSKKIIREAWRRVVSRVYRENDGEKSERRAFAKSLQGRYCKSNQNDCYRGGWWVSLQHNCSRKRQKEKCVSREKRVESVSIPELSDLERHGTCVVGDSVEVFNLKVSGHPSYSLEEDIIVHNCHRIAASSWSSVLPRFNAAWRVGLTATPRRKDGAQDVFFNHISDVTYSAKTNSQVPDLRVLNTYSQLKPISRGDYYVPVSDLNSAQILTQLGNDQFRAKDIVDQLVLAVQSGRKIMVVSERLYHLKLMSDMLMNSLFNLDLPFEPVIDFCTGEWFSGEVWEESNKRHKKGDFKMIKRTEDDFEKAERANVIFATKQVCVDGNSIVVDAITGFPFYIKDISEKICHDDVRLLSYDENNNIFYPNRVIASHDNGEAKVRDIFIGRGGIKSRIKFSVTDDHKVLTSRGWLKAEDIVIGDWVKLPSRFNCDDDFSDIDHEDARLLGYLIGDGCTSVVNNGSVYFFNIDESIIRDFSSLLIRHKAYLCETSHGKYAVRLGGKHGSGNKSSLRKLIEKHGLDGCRAWEKKLSYDLMQCKDEVAASLIAGLVASDGHIGKKKVSVCHISSSRILAYQIHLLLLRLGIVSSVYMKKSNKSTRRSDYWAVDVSGIFWVRKFKDIVGPFLPENKLNRLIELCNLKRKEGGFGRRVPEEQWLHAMRVVRSNGLSKKELGICNLVQIGASVVRNGVDRTLLEFILNTCENKTLRKWVSDDGIWERVCKIEDGRICRVYDLIMEKDHNFVCDGVLVHNCEEGLDIEALDVLVLSMPMGDVEQIVGRVRRWCFKDKDKCEHFCPWRAGQCNEKPKPIVVDVVDEDIPQLLPKWRRRQKFYKSIGTEVP